MTSLLQNSDHPAFDALSASQAAELIEQARALMRGAGESCGAGPLQGKHLGLVCASPDGADAMFFRRAAAELGASVAVIRAEAVVSSPLPDMQSTGRVLARLYDALECQGMQPALLERLSRAAGVPVYEGLATPGHPTARLAAMIDGDAAPDVKRRCVLQAALLKSLL
jgi:ornithine carbamoyltransferase